MMCDRNIPTKLKDKVYKTAIKLAMVYGAECWAVRKKEERKLHTTEMRMLRWARGNTRLDHVRNVDIWKEAHMYPMAEFLREKRLRWFGHVQISLLGLTPTAILFGYTRSVYERLRQRGVNERPQDSKRRRWDSNPRPLNLETCALTHSATAPHK